MGPRLDVARRAVALATAVSFALSPAAPLAAAPAQAPAPPPAVGPPAPKPTAAQLAKPAPKPTTSAAATPHDLGWPRAYATPSGGKIIVYQPQIASWDNQKLVVAYSAVSYEPKGATKPALGSVKVEADTKVSVSERLVSFKDFRITESNFPTSPQGTDARGGDGDRPVDPRERARHRAGPRAGQRGPQPDHPQGSAGREGGPAHDLLQPDARRAREHRRRADLEPDQGERPQIRRQHELGPLPARADRAPSTCARKGSS